MSNTYFDKVCERITPKLAAAWFNAGRSNPRALGRQLYVKYNSVDGSYNVGFKDGLKNFVPLLLLPNPDVRAAEYFRSPGFRKPHLMPRSSFNDLTGFDYGYSKRHKDTIRIITPDGLNYPSIPGLLFDNRSRLINRIIFKDNPDYRERIIPKKNRAMHARIRRHTAKIAAAEKLGAYPNESTRNLILGHTPLGATVSELLIRLLLEERLPTQEEFHKMLRWAWMAGLGSHQWRHDRDLTVTEVIIHAISKRYATKIRIALGGSQWVEVPH